MSVAPLPNGFRVTLDPRAKQLAPHLWFGGSPARVLRLTRAGRAAWAALQANGVTSLGTGRLARRLTDAGLAHPCPPDVPAADVTVIVPAYGRPDVLDRCLAGLGSAHRVLVVDDASPDPLSIERVAVRHGAGVLRREVNGGPGAARNTGLARCTSAFVAFVDSDCAPTGDWIDRLTPHFADPAVAAVAPRITAIAPLTWAGRYTAAQGSLDLGADPARVVPGGRVSYVPTAALLVRRADLPTGAAFDPALRVGEDVDLIWRLHAAGRRVRYDPSVTVAHREPSTWRALLQRRFRYGTSAAPLAQRHSGALAPLVLQPWPTATVLALLARRPVLAAGAYLGSVWSMTRTLRAAGVPTRGTGAAMATAAHQTWLGAGRYAVQFAAPALLVAARTRGLRLAAASLALGPALDAWREHRDSLDPARFTAGWLADQVAYGAGVWVGCVRHRTVAPLRPRLARRPVTVEPASPARLSVVGHSTTASA